MRISIFDGLLRQIDLSDTLKTEITKRAKEAGFDDVAFAPADAVPEARAGLEGFLARGYHGEMGWMRDTAARRAAPRALWPEAKTVIMLAMNYAPEHNPLETLKHHSRAAISVYARGRDYHDLIKKRLKQIARWLHQSQNAQVKVFVDTAPVMEKPLAQAAGLGWQGKHTNLVSRDFGSWLFLGSIFTDLEISPDEAGQDHCGSCRACLDICPTGAFPAPGKIDARRCISYLTIEHKTHIPAALRPLMGNRIYGCDDCLAVCPWNKYARTASEAAFSPRPGLDEPPQLATLAGLDDAAFRSLFAGSPIKRIGHARFIRNVMIAIGNSGRPDLLPAVMGRLNDPSVLVRAMAVWAYGRLANPDDVARAAQAALSGKARETDPDVAAEWRAARDRKAQPGLART